MSERSRIIRPHQSIKPFEGKFAQPIFTPAQYEVDHSFSFLTPFRQNDTRVVLDMDVWMSSDIDPARTEFVVGDRGQSYIVTPEDRDPVQRLDKVHKHLESHPEKAYLGTMGLAGKLWRFRTVDNQFRQETVKTQTEVDVLRAIRCLARTIDGLYFARLDDLEVGSQLEDWILVNFRPVEMEDIASAATFGDGHALRFALERPTEYQDLELTFFYDQTGLKLKRA